MEIINYINMGRKNMNPRASKVCTLLNSGGWLTSGSRYALVVHSKVGDNTSTKKAVCLGIFRSLGNYSIH